MFLATSRRLGPLLIAQMLGALNDNLFKNALVVMILFRAAEGSGAALVALAGGVFILPYVVFSAMAGRVADRFEKSRTIVAMKAAEVVLMVAAGGGLLLGSTAVSFVVLFGLGVQATFFGPLKYGILPGLLGRGELMAGNGLVEAGTFIGILVGTIAGSALFVLPGGAWIVSGAGLGVAVAGLGAAWFVPRVAAGVPGGRIGWGVVGETWRLLAGARENRAVWLCILGLSWFWVVGATVLAELPAIVRHGLGAEPEVFTLMLAFFSVGVGAGSMLCARLLRGEVSVRLVPWAGVGLSVFLLDFSVAVTGGEGLRSVGAVLGNWRGWRMLVDLLLLAGCGGLYSVPLYAVMQARAAPERLGSMVGANNVVNALGMVMAAGVTAGLAVAGVLPAVVLMGLAGVNLGVAWWIGRR